MSLYTSAKGGSVISPIEEGTYPAVCYGLVDIGYQYNETYKNSSPKIVVMWEIPSEKITIDGEEVSRTISQTYTNSLNEKAALRRDLIAWRGKDFTDAELTKFDLKTILGVPCLLSIVHKTYNGKTYANISAIAKVLKNMEAPKPTLPLLAFDLDKDPLEYIEALPEWLQNRIKASETYKDRIAGKGDTQGDNERSADVQEFITMDDEDGLPF